MIEGESSNQLRVIDKRLKTENLQPTTDDCEPQALQAPCIFDILLALC
jgi:hypothetical protein